MPRRNRLYGAILGDLCGQPFEFKANGYNKPIRIHNPDSVITDDSVMTLASAMSIIHGMPPEDCYKTLGRNYPNAGYGKAFKDWIQSDPATVNTSWGNGCLMRLSPFMYIPDKNKALKQALDSADFSHRHPVSYKAILDLYGAYREIINVTDIKQIVPFEKFEVKAGVTVDFCINLYKNFNNTHAAINCAVKQGGDTDTNASIVGELLNYHYNDITKEDMEYVNSKLDDYLRGILVEFNDQINEIEDV